MNIKVNCQNSILINNNIYVDPFKLKDLSKAKYIFITHSHFDHYSIDDISKILDNNTIIICPLSMKEEVEKHFNVSTLFVEPNKTYTLDDFTFETFHSYNINKPFHPKSNNWVGYTLCIDNEKITIVGDSDVTDELKELKTDILLLPIGGHFTMTLDEAAELTNLIQPKKVIPTHYGEVVGNINMGATFKTLVNKDIICELQLK